jgi:hypothetical protein
MSEKKKFWGKYRGTVFDNIDPEFRGRLIVMVPDVSTLLPTSWALPCAPLATLQGGTFVVPEIGDAVWVEFEHGDPDYPIWVGGYWSVATVPVLTKLATPGVPVIMLTTVAQSAVIVSDSPIPPMAGPGVMLMATPASYIAVSPEMIQIFSPTIQINGVTIVNDGALMVTP